jgi:hypothetical protein
MPTNGLPKRTIRASQELWDAFVAACPDKDHGGAATVLREFMEWYTWQKGAKAPRRPPKPKAGPAHDASSEPPDTPS